MTLSVKMSLFFRNQFGSWASIRSKIRYLYFLKGTVVGWSNLSKILPINYGLLSFQCSIPGSRNLERIRWFWKQFNDWKIERIKTKVSGNLEFFFSVAILPVWNALIRDCVSWTRAWTWAVLVSATILVSLVNYYILFHLWWTALVSISPDQNNWSISFMFVRFAVQPW